MCPRSLGPAEPFPELQQRQAGQETVTAEEPHRHRWSYPRLGPASVLGPWATFDKVSLPPGLRVSTGKPGMWFSSVIAPSLTVGRNVLEVSDFVVDDLPAFGHDLKSLYLSRSPGKTHPGT